jgi:hypothetical protein
MASECGLGCLLMTGLPEPNDPQSDDVVLGGGQPLPYQAAVLGGAEVTLLRSFPTLSPVAQEAALWQLVDGGAGLALVIGALASPDLAVRRTAFELLQLVDAPEAKRSVAQGFPLYPGEILYLVYESVVAYNDCGYDLVADLAERWHEPPAMLGIFLTQAQDALEDHHKRLAIADLMSGYPHFFDTASDPTANAEFWRWPVLEFCEAHDIPVRLAGELSADYALRFGQIDPAIACNPDVNQFFLEEYNYAEMDWEDEWDRQRHYGSRTIAFLVAAQQHDLMAQLWLEVIGPLAFMSEQPVSQITYCDLQADGSTIVL